MALKQDLCKPRSLDRAITTSSEYQIDLAVAQIMTRRQVSHLQHPTNKLLLYVHLLNALITNR